MLQITIPAGELWDEAREEIITVESCTIALEHSLVSLSKWESKWHKPFLSDKQKTQEESLDYIRCMTITQNVPWYVYHLMTETNIKAINEYIDNPMTATTFSRQENKKQNRSIITAEIIYYWMIAFNIPQEYQKWHLNKLLTLIQVCDIKNQPEKKMSKREIMNQHRSLNAVRRAKRH